MEKPARRLVSAAQRRAAEQWSQRVKDTNHAWELLCALKPLRSAEPKQPEVSGPVDWLVTDKRTGKLLGRVEGFQTWFFARACAERFWPDVPVRAFLLVWVREKQTTPEGKPNGLDRDKQTRKKVQNNGKKHR